MDINIPFCRRLLAEAHKAVKQRFPAINLRKAAWVYQFSFGRDQWEFHGPDGFYWNGRASNAYDARYKGWMAYLHFKGLDAIAKAENRS